MSKPHQRLGIASSLAAHSPRMICLFAALWLAPASSAQRAAEPQVVEFRLDLLYSDAAETEDLLALRAPTERVADRSVLQVQRLRPDAALRGKLAEGRQRDKVVFLGKRTLYAASGQEATLLIGVKATLPRAPDAVPDEGEPGSVQKPLAIPPPMVAPNSTRRRLEREFGILLRLVPMVAEDGRMLVRVSPEVRGVDFENAMSDGRELIPQLVARKHDQLVEVTSGQPFIISGLFLEDDLRFLRRIPELEKEPLIQRLAELQQSRMEGSFVIVATPQLVEGSLGVSR